MHNIATLLKDLRFMGMLKAYEELGDTQSHLSFDVRLSHLLRSEAREREQKALRNRLGRARFKSEATLDEVQVSDSRGIDKVVASQLQSLAWVKDKSNILLTGACGTGKTFIATAISKEACKAGYSTRYIRMANLLAELDASREEGAFPRKIASFTKIDVMIIDDFCLSAFSEAEQKDFFELIEERTGKTSTIFTSQNPPATWHGLMPNPVIADAILDRIHQNTLRIELKGESRRRRTAEAVN